MKKYFYYKLRVLVMSKREICVCRKYKELIKRDSSTFF